MRVLYILYMYIYIARARAFSLSLSMCVYTYLEREVYEVYERTEVCEAPTWRADLFAICGVLIFLQKLQKDITSWVIVIIFSRLFPFFLKYHL